jgi:NADH-quinone oxidoreductase subunit N
VIFFQFLSILILLSGIALVLILEFLNLNKAYHAYVTLVALLGSFLSIVLYLATDGSVQFFGIDVPDTQLNYSNALLVLDQFTAFFALLFTGLMILVIFASISDLDSVDETNYFVYYVLMLFVTIGMILVSSAIDLAALVVSWEMVSIPSYLLVAFKKRDRTTSEAAIKFFIIGSISSAMMLFGASFLYGIAGSTNIYQILSAIISLTGNDAKNLTGIIVVGLGLVVAGFGFKMGVVPFQWWLPDTYEGSMTSVTTMLASASKKVGFAAGFRVLMVPLLAYGAEWSTKNLNAQEAFYTLLLIVAIVTMILGNVAALAQTRMKRLLAYSSIGQAGYLMLALASASLTADNSSIGLASGLFHTFSHGIMTAVAFICVLAITRIIGSDEIDQYRGLRQILPKTSMALAMVLMGLAGIPPLIGFLSKFFIFFAAIDAGNTLTAFSIGPLFYLGAFVAIITSAISVYYYVRVIKIMMVDAPSEIVKSETLNTKVPWNISIPTGVATFIVIFSFLSTGILIDYFFAVAKSAIVPVMGI